MSRTKPFSILSTPIILATLMAVCNACDQSDIKSSQAAKETKAVERQQSQYAKGQPIPAYDWSLERDLLIQLYGLRNQKAATHTVWRSDMGVIEGDCASYGFSLPYDTSLTNPSRALWEEVDDGTGIGIASAVVGQAEPNGIFSSTNTSATWVMCVGTAGQLNPVYVEAKVTVYPGPVTVDYETNRVTMGPATVSLEAKK